MGRVSISSSSMPMRELPISDEVEVSCGACSCNLEPTVIEVIKEVTIEVPVEVIKTVEIEKIVTVTETIEVPVEKIVERVVEVKVPVEVIKEKIIIDSPKMFEMKKQIDDKVSTIRMLQIALSISVLVCVALGVVCVQ